MEAITERDDHAYVRMLRKLLYATAVGPTRGRGCIRVFSFLDRTPYRWNEVVFGGFAMSD
jgi:hypothetical protein